MEQKLAFLASKEQAIALRVQMDASSHIILSVQNLFSDSKASKKIKEKFLAEKISKLESMS